MGRLSAPVAACVLLAGCATQPDVKVYMPTYPRTEIHKTIIEYNSIEELNRIWFEEHDGTSKVPSFVVWVGNRCEVHVLRVTVDNWHQETYWRGHEDLHCTHGDYHD